MSSETELEQEVVEALRAGRKIEGIKLLREHRNIDLKGAKEVVDQYIKENPEACSAIQEASSGNSLLLLIVIGVVGYLIYRYVL